MSSLRRPTLFSCMQLRISAYFNDGGTDPGIIWNRHWLRQYNTMQHATILSMGDVSKNEASKFFQEDLLHHIPDNLRSGIAFEEVYEVMGGKLAHLSDYVTEYVRSDGKITRNIFHCSLLFACSC